MDRTRMSRDGAEAPGGAGLGFAAFVLAHEGCGGALEESRLDGDTLACRCPPCDETRVFRTTGTAGKDTRP